MRYLIFQLSGIDYCTPLPFNVDVDFSLWLGSDVVLTVLVRIVGPVRSSFLLLQSFQLTVDIVLVPCVIVISYCIYVPKQLFLSLFALCLIFLWLLFPLFLWLITLFALYLYSIYLLFWLFLLFLNLFLQLLRYLHLFGSLLLQYSYFCLLFQLHLLLPIIKIADVGTNFLGILFYFLLYFKAHFWLFPMISQVDKWLINEMIFKI